MSGIKSVGMNSGLSDFYDKLESSEKEKLKPYTARDVHYKAKLSSWGIMQTSLEKFKAATDKLQNINSAINSKITSNNSAFNVALSSAAIPGNYSVDVEELASAQSLQTPSVQNKDTILGDDNQSSSTIIIKQEGQKSPFKITLATKNTSLSEIRDAINKKNGSVNATIIKSNDHSFHLILTARDTGEINAMNVSTDDKNLSALFNFGNAVSNTMKEQTPAKDSLMKINEITVKRSSNFVSDAIDGVSFTILKKTDVDHSEQLNIIKDKQALKEAVTNFVDAYNSLQTTISNQTKFTSVRKGSAQDVSNGSLIGDATLRNIQNSLQRAFSLSNYSGTINSFSQMGVHLGTNGKLIVDENKFDKTISESSDEVVRFISGYEKKPGLAENFNIKLKGILNPGGILQTMTDGIDKAIKNNSRAFDNANAHIEAIMKQYRVQFEALNRLSAQFDKTSDYLSGHLRRL